MTQQAPDLTELQRAEAAYLAANWKRMPRRERRSVIRLWWKTGVRYGDSFADSFRTISETVRPTST